MSVSQVSPLDGTVGGVGATLPKETTVLGAGLGSLGSLPDHSFYFLPVGRDGIALFPATIFIPP